MSLQDAASPKTKRMQADPGRRSQRGPVMDVSEGERLDFFFFPPTDRTTAADSSRPRLSPLWFGLRRLRREQEEP